MIGNLLFGMFLLAGTVIALVCMNILKEDFEKRYESEDIPVPRLLIFLGVILIGLAIAVRLSSLTAYAVWVLATVSYILHILYVLSIKKRGSDV